VNLVTRLLGIAIAVVVVALVYSALTAVVPMTGFEGLLMLALLITVTITVIRRGRRGLAKQ
jgi:hypothetical protein